MGPGHEASTDIPPVISPASKGRIERLIQVGVFPFFQILKCSTKYALLPLVCCWWGGRASFGWQGNHGEIKFHAFFILLAFSCLCQVEGYPDGNFCGPSIITKMKPSMTVPFLWPYILKSSCCSHNSPITPSSTFLCEAELFNYSNVFRHTKRRFLDQCSAC